MNQRHRTPFVSLLSEWDAHLFELRKQPHCGLHQREGGGTRSAEVHHVWEEAFLPVFKMSLAKALPVADAFLRQRLTTSQAGKTVEILYKDKRIETNMVRVRPFRSR